MIKKSIFIWLSIIPLAFFNGALREYVTAPLIGMKYALPISGAILCLLVFIVSLIFVPKLGKGTKRTYWTIGGLWLVLTILFESILGLIRRISFSEIIEAYDITTGNLWLIVVAFIGIIPWLIGKIKNYI